MATKLHCDVCDAVIVDGRIEVELRSGNVELRGPVEAKVNGKEGFVCHGCIHRLFVSGTFTYAFPRNEFVRSLEATAGE